MTDDVIVWVVLTGSPKCAVAKSTVAAPVSAANPCTGSSFVIPIPNVRTILHPPRAVPSPIATAQVTITQVGTSSLAICPAESRASVITPMAFWASFAPWL